jgi:predicted nucleotide-binding protein (sugar kinase/HSP70/actin superfamily)
MCTYIMATFVSYSAYNTMIDENMKRKEKKRKNSSFLNMHIIFLKTCMNRKYNKTKINEERKEKEKCVFTINI